jgi:hypothetical protein
MKLSKPILFALALALNSLSCATMFIEDPSFSSANKELDHPFGKKVFVGKDIKADYELFLSVGAFDPPYAVRMEEIIPFEIIHWPTSYESGFLTANVKGYVNFPIGMFQKEQEGLVYYLDTNSDHFLDTRSTEVVVPPFILKMTFSRPGDTKLLIQTLDTLLAEIENYPIQGDELLSETMSKFVSSVMEGGPEGWRQENYDLWFYLTYQEEMPYAAGMALDRLRRATSSEENPPHPLLYLWKYESQMSAGEIYSAPTFLERLLLTHPSLAGLDRPTAEASFAAAEYPPIFTVKSLEGAELFWNVQGANGRTHLRGNPIQQNIGYQRLNLLLEGYVFEVVFSRLKEIQYEWEETMPDYNLLEKHHSWEKRHQQENQGGFRDHGTSWLKFAGKDVLHWEFSYDARGFRVKHYNYSFVSNRAVITLSFPVLPASSQTKVISPEKSQSIVQEFLAAYQWLPQGVPYSSVSQRIEE